MVKNPLANAGDVRDAGLIPGSGRSPGGGNGNSLQMSCLEKFHGQRSLVCCSPWGHRQKDMTEHTHTNILFRVFVPMFMREIDLGFLSDSVVSRCWLSRLSGSLIIN